MSIHLCLSRCLPALLFGAVIVSARGDQDPASLAARDLTEDDFPRLQEVARDVYTFEALTGPADDRYTTNSMFIVTGAGVVVADGQGSPEATAELVGAIARVTDQPITDVVIASDHGDHTGGNASFPAGAVFIAHRNSLPALARAATNGGVMPDRVIDDRLELTRGGRRIDILFLGRAHTGGDLFVYLRDEKVLFTSEVFLNHLFAGYRSAWPGEWLEVMERAEAIDADLRIPGHGFVDSRTALEKEWREYREQMRFVYDEVTRLRALGLGVDAAIEQADFGRFATWSDAASERPVVVRRIYAELDGQLP